MRCENCGAFYERDSIAEVQHECGPTYEKLQAEIRYLNDLRETMRDAFRLHYGQVLAPLVAIADVVDDSGPEFENLLLVGYKGREAILTRADCMRARDLVRKK